jgi:hypothetical protein
MRIVSQKTYWSAFSIAAFLSFLLLSTGMTALAVSSVSQNLSVSTQTQDGSALTGYYIQIVNSSGQAVQTGFSPGVFVLAAGSYTVSVGDFSGQYFSHWSDGTTTRAHPITITSSAPVSLTAIYCSIQGGCGSSSGPEIAVGSRYSNGSSLVGMFTELQQNGNIVSTGYTPVSFPVNNGQNYTVTVSNYGTNYFNQWGNGFSVRSMPVMANSSTTSLTAVFTTTQQSPPPTGYSITIKSNDLNGTALTGFYIDVRVNGNHIASGFTPVTIQSLEPGVQYQIVTYWYGNYYFREFSNGDLNRYALVTFNSTGATSVTYDALYQYVPKSQAADLNVIAELPNGTLLGTTFNNTGYIQHTPGMWLTITPGSGTPFTGTFTGGSILPFVLFNTQPYTISMTAGYQNYQFAYWKDNNSTNPDRTITLNGNDTYIAVYVYV